MTPAVLNPARRAVMIDMAYEIGGSGLEQFVHLLAALRLGDWALASTELKKSLLYSQVPHREAHNAEILRSGELGSLCPDARTLIRLHEGLTLTAQPDAKGKWAIGYGHDIPAQGASGLTCTITEAEAWFDHDFVIARARARYAVGVEIWGQEDSL